LQNQFLPVGGGRKTLQKHSPANGEALGFFSSIVYERARKLKGWELGRTLSSALPVLSFTPLTVRKCEKSIGYLFNALQTTIEWRARIMIVLSLGSLGVEVLVEFGH
jgi:hypothetical protein